MRAFVAVNLPDDVRADLHGALGPLRSQAGSVRWTRADALHITLQFLGSIPEARVAEIRTALVAAAAGRDAFALRIAGFDAFPSLHRARVWWLGAESGPLVDLQRAVSDSLARLGFEPEDRPYHPHVTVGRAPRAVRRADVAALEAAASAVRWTGCVEITSVDLMQSHLARSGARYEVVAPVPLGG